MENQVDLYNLSQKYSVLLLFDYPVNESNPYNKLSEGILAQIDQAAVVFSETDLPEVLNPQSKPESDQQEVKNVFSIYCIQQIWLLLGLFIGNGKKKVHIFTDAPDIFTEKLHLSKPENFHLKNRVFIHQCVDSQTFSIEVWQNPWSQFNNQEVLSNYEQEQLRIILKKFIKQVVTSKPPNNLEKLIHISQNLVKAHLSTISKDRYRVQSDLAFNFVRSLFLDKVLDNPTIYTAILNNTIESFQDFETFTKINYTPRFSTIIEKIKLSIQLKQQQQQFQQQTAQAELQESPESKAENKVEEDKGDQSEQEALVVKQAIQALLDQYLNLFNKAKIYEIKKLQKLIKAIANYIAGLVMKKETSPENTKEKPQAQYLKRNQQLICANILRILAKMQLIKMIDANVIEHDKERVGILLHNPQQRLLKEENNDFLMDKEQCLLILDQPMNIFKKEIEKEKEDHQESTKPPTQKLDPYDQFIEKLVVQMRNSQHFPKTLRELERLIKRHIVKKGESTQEEDETVLQIMSKMNKKGMFTQKFRTGESKEHAKDPKLKNVDLIELYKKEKEQIPIVFESSYAINKATQ